MDTDKTNASLPKEGFLRLKQVLELFPVKPATWYRGMNAGVYPKPIALGPSMRAYRVSDIRDLLARAEAGTIDFSPLKGN